MRPARPLLFLGAVALIVACAAGKEESCPDGLKACGDLCVQTSVDCSTCKGNVCAAAGGGTSTSPSGTGGGACPSSDETQCGTGISGCKLLAHDDENCGKCGKVCDFENGETCQNGTCAL